MALVFLQMLIKTVAFFRMVGVIINKENCSKTQPFSTKGLLYQAFQKSLSIRLFVGALLHIPAYL